MQEIEIDIQRFQKKLKRQAREHGLYENFGSKEVEQLKKKYAYANGIQIGLSILFFENWCSEFECTNTLKYVFH